MGTSTVLKMRRLRILIELEFDPHLLLSNKIINTLKLILTSSKSITSCLTHLAKMVNLAHTNRATFFHNE